MATIEFIEKIRRFALTHRRSIFVRMRACEHIDPSVALVLAAEIQRCQHHRGQCINGNNPRTDRTTRLLRDIGFFKLLNFIEPPSKARVTDADATTYIAMTTGEQGGGQYVDRLKELVLGEFAVTSRQLTNDLFRGLVAAMENVEHAYPADIACDYLPVKGSRWWMAGYRNLAAREIMFMAYDQGVGIPRTITRNYRERVREFLASLGRIFSPEATTDDELLLAAMEIGRTRTGLDGRGRGLNDFRKLIDNSGGQGALLVLSGRGSYLYTSTNGERAVALRAPFHGTLIVWRLANSPQVEWSQE